MEKCRDPDHPGQVLKEVLPVIIGVEQVPWISITRRNVFVNSSMARPYFENNVRGRKNAFEGWSQSSGFGFQHPAGSATIKTT
jgi:hypothetical protein